MCPQTRCVRTPQVERGIHRQQPTYMYSTTNSEIYLRNNVMNIIIASHSYVLFCRLNGSAFTSPWRSSSVRFCRITPAHLRKGEWTLDFSKTYASWHPNIVLSHTMCSMGYTARKARHRRFFRCWMHKYRHFISINV